MIDAAKISRSTKPAEPRLLRFTVNGKFFYAMKWSDELTENRREINYTVRAAGTKTILCLLVDCPLRIEGTPDLVSAQSTGGTVDRAGGIVWDIATTVWEDGSTDDEGVMRLCSPDVFKGRSEYLRQDLTRMVREYRMGTRQCHTTSLPTPPASSPVVPDTGPIEQRLDKLAVAVERAAVPKSDTPAPLTAAMLKQEFAKMMEALKAIGDKVTQEFDDLAPHISAERRKAYMAWIRKTKGICSENEHTAALLAVNGMKYSEIAKRLPTRKDKIVSREAVRQMLERFERKTGARGMFSKGTYRQNARIEAEQRQLPDDKNEEDGDSES